MMIWLLVLLVIGVNFTLWGLIGGLRLIDASTRRWRIRPTGRKHRQLSPARRMRISHVAVLMAAHNEELVIASTLALLAELVPRTNTHVVSDASTDDTVALALAAGVQ